jgi:transposase
MPKQGGLQVSMDVGSRSHWVVIGRRGRGLESFQVEHTGPGFEGFFERVERQRRCGEQVLVLAEGSGGWLRPLDGLMQQRGYRLWQINQCKAARFRETFSGPAKTDRLDAERGLQLLELRRHWAGPGTVCEPVRRAGPVHRHVRALTQRRRRLVQEKTRLSSQLQANLQAVCPGLVSITRRVDNLWFLHFLKARRQLRQLARLRPRTVRRIAGVGVRRAAAIGLWQRQAEVSEEAAWMSPLVTADVHRLLQLRAEIAVLEKQLQQLGTQSRLFQLILSIPGFGVIAAAELCGEIGQLERFRNSSALALYLGVAVLDYSSGKRTGSRRPHLVNRTAKNALCTATGRHRQLVPESRLYYERKYRENGRRYAKAVRALARFLVRVIWSMAKQDREYVIRDVA